MQGVALLLFGSGRICEIARQSLAICGEPWSCAYSQCFHFGFNTSIFAIFPDFKGWIHPCQGYPTIPILTGIYNLE
jgi:hypothetical protein